MLYPYFPECFILTSRKRLNIYESEHAMINSCLKILTGSVQWCLQLQIGPKRRSKTRCKLGWSGSIFGRFGFQVGWQVEAKLDPKSITNRFKHWSKFWLIPLFDINVRKRQIFETLIFWHSNNGFAWFLLMDSNSASKIMWISILKSSFCEFLKKSIFRDIFRQFLEICEIFD